MKSNIGARLVYNDIPSFNEYSQYRDYLRIASNYSCTYCTLTENESPGSTFHIDHFRPFSKFKSLENDCTNLRYSCPKCNAHKSNKWISTDEGCIFDCNSCKEKSCEKNIERFINVLIEDPNDYLFCKDELIYSRNDEAIGTYVIDKLRLNRPQLQKIRLIRAEYDKLTCKINDFQKMIHEDRKLILDIEKHVSEMNDILDEEYVQLFKLTMDMMLLLIKKSQFILDDIKRSVEIVIGYKVI